MKPDAAAIVIVAVLIILILLFMTAKGEKRRITLVNSENERFEISVEVANNSITRAKGLMGRSSLGEYEGMLFEFDRPGIYPFWMLNTTIPLDAIYIAGDGSVVDILEMEPCGLNITKCRLYTPKAEAMYVLEVNRGFSGKHSVMAGKSALLMD
ncbi:MAG: DUF192 domain-containing protein [Candidatus Micrarchaeota archaeon]